MTLIAVEAFTASKLRAYRPDAERHTHFTRGHRIGR